MALEFSQEEVESELSGLLKHGRRKDVAVICGLHESTIKRQFNSDDETPSAAYRLLQIGCALDELDEKEGEAFWCAVMRFRELSKKRKPFKNICLSLETGKLNSEVADFVHAKLANASFDVQMKELLEAQAQLEKVKETLISERNRLHFCDKQMDSMKLVG